MEEKRKIAFSIVATDYEKQKIKDNAKEMGLPTNVYIRYMAMKGDR